MDDRGDYNSSFALRAVELKGILHIKVFKIAMKNGNKQCLFDTPRKVMVNKEMMSEYQAIRKTVYALS